jgi:hypothetical protein
MYHLQLKKREREKERKREREREGERWPLAFDYVSAASFLMDGGLLDSVASSSSSSSSRQISDNCISPP